MPPATCGEIVCRLWLPCCGCRLWLPAGTDQLYQQNANDTGTTTLNMGRAAILMAYRGMRAVILPNYTIPGNSQSPTLIQSMLYSHVVP